MVFMTQTYRSFNLYATKLIISYNFFLNTNDNEIVFINHATRAMTTTYKELQPI